MRGGNLPPAYLPTWYLKSRGTLTENNRRQLGHTIGAGKGTSAMPQGRGARLGGCDFGFDVFPQRSLAIPLFSAPNCSPSIRVDGIPYPWPRPPMISCLPFNLRNLVIPCSVLPCNLCPLTWDMSRLLGRLDWMRWSEYFPYKGRRLVVYRTI